MLSRWDRWVLYYDFLLRPYPAEAGDMPLSEIIPRLHQRFEAGHSVKLINNDLAAIRIQAMQVDQDTQTVALLINYADTDATDPVFANLETGQLRLEPKLEGEGVALSAHMVVSLLPSQVGAYQSVLEDVPSVGKTKVIPFLRSEFRAVSEFVFDDEEGRVRRCRPIPDMVGHASQTLRADLEQGELSHLELVALEGDPTELDEDGSLEMKSKSIVFKVKADNVGDGALDLINRVRRRGRAVGYPAMRVRFKKPEGKQRTVFVGSLREDAGEVLYNRVEQVSGFELPLEQSTEEMRHDLVEKLTELLVDVRDNN